LDPQNRLRIELDQMLLKLTLFLFVNWPGDAHSKAGKMATFLQGVSEKNFHTFVSQQLNSENIKMFFKYVLFENKRFSL